MNIRNRKAEDRGAKYRIIIPPESNGYVYVVGERTVCTCFGDFKEAMENARLIAAALNAYKGES